MQYARENAIPYLGICLGMQVAVIEAARNLAGLKDAMSTEFDRDTPHPVIALITEWQDQTGDREERSEQSEMGGTMRLGLRQSPCRPVHWRRKVTAVRKSWSATDIATK